jgi:hypothetical protein
MLQHCSSQLALRGPDSGSSRRLLLLLLHQAAASMAPGPAGMGYKSSMVM